MLKFYFLLIFGMIFSFSFAQEASREIIITYKDGRETRGLLPEDGISNYQVIDLQVNQDIIKIQPEQIQKISSPETGFLILPYMNNGIGYFMESLVLGEANLFFLKDRQGNPQFIVVPDRENSQEINSGNTTNQGRSYRLNPNSYLGMLDVLFSNCSPEELNKTKLSRNSLTSVFKNYNRCRNNLIYSANKPKTEGEFRLSLLAGASFNKISPTTSTLAENFETDEGISAGVEVAYLFSRMSIAFGVNYAEKGGIGDYNLSNYEKAVFDYKFLELGLSGRFHILGHAKKFQPYVGLTLNQGIVLNKETATIKTTSNGEEVNFYQGTQSEPETTIPLTVNYEAGLNYSFNEKGGIVLRGIYYNHEDGRDKFKFSGITVLTGYYFRF